MPFNQNHRRWLLASFEQIDKLFAQAVLNLGPADDGLLFPLCTPDATPTQRRVIADYIASFRNASRRFLEVAKVQNERPSKGALWSLRVSLDFVWVALAEMEPKHLQGYGTLDTDAAIEIERALAELHSILRQLSEYLEQGLGGDIAARLQKLDQTRDEVALLRALERITSSHGLVEFRATLTWLTEKLERPWLEVAFFGRVSCGKSSLVNALIGRDILPTGVTPVTAVPTRIVPGHQPGATVGFARSPSKRIELTEIADFATEERNPGNGRNVTDIIVEVPSSRLADGVCFVDTPGLGSLATAGAAQSKAYLPRCDIGVLLVDAAGALSEEDISVARAVLESGALLIPVLSKADLLLPAELQKMHDYIRRQFRAAIGMNPAVTPISVAPAQAHTALQWFESELAPRLRERRAILSASLRRKVGGVREAVLAALSLRARRESVDGREAPELRAASRALADARSVLAKSKQRINGLAEKARGHGTALVDVAAGSLAESWPTRSGVSRGARSLEQPVTAAALSVAREADRLGAEYFAVIDEARQILEEALANAAQAVPSSPSGIDSLPSPDARPLFDPQYLFHGLQLRPGIQGLFGRAALCADIRRQLAKKLGPSMARATETYSGALNGWATRSLASLEKAFDAAAASFSALERHSTDKEPAVSEDMHKALNKDIDLLKSWNEERLAGEKTK